MKDARFDARVAAAPAGTTLAMVYLGEVPTLLSVVGGVLTLSGVLIVNTRGRRR